MLISIIEIKSTNQCDLNSGWELGITEPSKSKRAVFWPGKAKCSICGLGISDGEWRLYQTCSSWKCRRQYRSGLRISLQKKKKQERIRQAELEKRLCMLRTRAANIVDLKDPKKFLPVVIPATCNPVTYFSNDRRVLFQSHLKKVFSEAQKSKTNICAPQTDNAMQSNLYNSTTIIQEACALCRGRCCINGKDHAYFSAKTISRFAENHPGLDESELFVKLVSYIEANTIKNSCIFHGNRGCSLPRETRSDTCNGFECNALSQLRQSMSGSGPHRLFLVAVEKNKVVRFAFLSK